MFICGNTMLGIVTAPDNFFPAGSTFLLSRVEHNYDKPCQIGSNGDCMVAN
jgi:hypothetical protein